jgi:tetratricopeptide (TPR) repeat protein
MAAAARAGIMSNREEALGDRAAPGRNDPCPCGSGRKYKHCCLRAQGKQATGAEGPSRSAPPAGRRPAARPYLEAADRLRRAGRFAEAIEPLRQAIAFDPSNPVVHHNLGLACLSCGRLAEAVAPLQRAIGLKPDFAHAYLLLGIVMQGLGRDGAAVAAFRRAAGLAPNLIAANDRLGDLLFAHGQAAEAAQSFRRAAAASPRTTPGQLAAAKALLAEDDPCQAEDSLRRTLASNPKSDEAHRMLGQLALESGRFEEARSHFEQAIAVSPHVQESSYLGLVGCGRMTEADRPLIARMAKMLESQSLVAPQRMKLHFALGKALEDCGDYAEAMRHFDAANRIRRGFSAFDQQQLAALVDRMIARCTRAYIASGAARAVDDETPVFILGMPRSGTTLVEQIVSSHPRVYAGGELPFWERHAPAWVANAGEDPGAAFIGTLGVDYLALLRRLSPSAARVTDKMPSNFLWIGLIRLAFPRARIIHCRRHPVDTCLSLYTHFFAASPGYASDRGALVFCYRQYARLMAHWRTVLPADRFLEVEYESLVSDAEAGARRLIAFCGLDWDDACLRPENNNRRIDTVSSWQARQPIYRSSVGRWRRYEPWLGELRELLLQ